MKQLHIFIVDDDIDDQEILMEAFTEIDASILCTTASNGHDGLLKFSSDLFKPDMMIVDLNMPKVNGKQFISRVKQLPLHCHIPVIIYSTSSAKKDVDELLELGATHFFEKPNNFTKLKNELKLIIMRFNPQNV